MKKRTIKINWPFHSQVCDMSESEIDDKNIKSIKPFVKPSISTGDWIYFLSQHYNICSLSRSHSKMLSLASLRRDKSKLGRNRFFEILFLLKNFDCKTIQDSKLTVKDNLGNAIYFVDHLHFSSWGEPLQVQVAQPPGS